MSSFPLRQYRAMTRRIPDSLLSELSDFIASQLGLHFPRERWVDLEQGLYSAAAELSLEDAKAYAQRLVSSSATKDVIEILAKHLTVGETYFFREKRTFQILEEDILPEIIHPRRESDKRLRIWSAGCCTGEEPYSLAILLSRLIPDLNEWSITLLATDINPQFLRKASEGVYSEWSFRETPEWVKQHCFKKSRDGRFKLLPLLSKIVTFSYLNLVDDCYPSLLTNTNAMDIILCRNVLMYFAPRQVKKVVVSLCNCLIDGGWLVVSPSETSQLLSSQFTAVNFSGAILYRKDSEKRRVAEPLRLLQDEGARALAGWSHEVPEPTGPQIPPRQNLAPTVPAPLLEVQEPQIGAPLQTLCDEGLQALEQGRYGEAAEKLLNLLSRQPHDAKALALLARVYANEGKLTEAKDLCEKAIINDKLNPQYHYLLAAILLAQGQADGAVKSFKRVLYLDQNFILAHVTLGNLARQRGRLKESEKHYKNALSLLAACAPEEALPAAEGMTAGRMIEIIRTTSYVEQVA